MNGMFAYCTSLENVTALSHWDTHNVTDLCSMFQGCTALASLDGLAQWDTHNATIMTRMLDGCSNLTTMPKWYFFTSSNC
jgi:surface protein